VITLSELRTTRRDSILATAEKYGARNVRVFGSVARGDSTAASDIDLLVDLQPGRSLMDLGGLLMELEDQLHCGVDVATVRMLRPEIREQALADAVPL
jgi:predicted nucleotidyltransferase